MNGAPKTSKDYTGSYRRLRSRLASQGTTIRAWSRSKGHNPWSVYSVAKGLRADGPTARRIAKDLATI